MHRMRSKNRQSSASESTKGEGTVHQEKTSSDGMVGIAEYIKSRFVSCCDAPWRLSGFEIHGKFPPVERLSMHLPGLNFVIVQE